MASPTIRSIQIETHKIVRNIVAEGYEHAEKIALYLLQVDKEEVKPKVSRELNGSFTVSIKTE